ncbi:MAG: phospholipase D family protein [Lachnospiraceae bacterium]|nr:phospholipase D family protein [Lachnospiraceae bacterium]
MDLQLSIFDIEGDNTIHVGDSLKVVKARFEEEERLRWEDLFEGFDELYAITFSSGMRFMEKVLKKFSHAEIIFGCEEVMDNSLAAIMALELTQVETIVKNKAAVYMSERMEKEELKLFVSRDAKSHEKLFLLKNRDGKVRVITGSANMSASAFCGVQRENIVYFDDDKAYEYYMNRFMDFRDMCSDNVNEKVIQRMVQGEEELLRDEPEMIPIAETIKKKKMIVIEESHDEENIDIVADVRGLEAELKPMLPKPQKDGKILVTAEQMTPFKRKYKEHRQAEVAREKQLPKLHLDVDDGTLNFNGKELNLDQGTEKIKNDIDIILGYIDSLSVSYGDYKKSQMDYFAFMNWYFASIFMPYLRLVAAKNNYDVIPFPVYGIIYGDSNGGKTTFVQILSKMMCGKKIPYINSPDFTYTSIEALKRGCEGLPINIDDLAKEQYNNHHEKIIKNEEWGIREGFVHYPAVVITTNKLPSITQDIAKRVFICRIDTKIDREIGVKSHRRIKESMRNVGTAFFCEYVKRMLPVVISMSEQMKSSDDNLEYFPDIFAESSKIIKEIIAEHVETENYPYVRDLNYVDCFGSVAVGRNAMEKIMLAWKNEPKQFKIDRRQNKLVYEYPQNSNRYELQYILDELPSMLNAKKTSTSLVMELDKAEELFGTTFKKKFWEK